MFATGLAGVSATAESSGSSIGIIPAPAEYERLSGGFTLDAGTKIICPKQDEMEVGRVLQAGLKLRTGIELGIESRPGKTETHAIRLELVPQASMAAEGYTLNISTNSVVLRAASAAGLFYGAQSWLQLASANGAPDGKITLPALRISDAPRYAWRGLMLDESRHFFGKQTVEELLDVMAYLKLNRFHWHLTDEPGWRIEIKKYPNLTRVGARGNYSDSAAPPEFYTQADIREIVDYARQRHIEIIPEIDMPGHATAAARAYPEISGGGTNQWNGFTFNPAKAETYVFLENVLKEVGALFPAPYIHLGGDEVHYGNQSWSTDPRIVKFTRDHGMTNAVQLEQCFVRRMAGVINGLGKTAMGWDEIAAAGVSPSKTVVMWWHHEKPGVLTEALEKNFPVVLCPRRPCYFDFVQDDSHQFGRRWKGEIVALSDVYSFPTPEITALVPAGKESNVLGMEACVWTERIQDRKRLDFMTFPRLAALAEAAWTPASEKNEEQFEQRCRLFLRELDRRQIPYFNPFNPAATPEPSGPGKKLAGTANG